MSDAASERRISNVVLALLVLLVSATTIGAAISAAVPHGTLGLRVAWRTTAAQLTVAAVEPHSAADLAGLAAGDRIVAFPSPADRVALVLQSNLKTGNYLAVGQSVSFSIERNGSVVPMRLVATPAPVYPNLWVFELRLLLYLLGVLIGGALVFTRPSPVAWGFALFVIFAQQPNILLLEFVGRAGSPWLFFGILLAIVPCAVAVGFLGLVAFAARFPAQSPQPGYAAAERALRAFLALVVVGFVEYYLGELYGWPSISRTVLVSLLNYVPAFASIVLLGRTLVHSRGDDRVRLGWAIVGPGLGTLLTLADVALVATGLPYTYATAIGALGSISPFSMLYAMLRHRVLEIDDALNRTLAESVSLASVPSDGLKPDRVEMARRTALLFSANLPLTELYAQLAGLLAKFVNAESVLIAVGDANDARLEYSFEGGHGARPDSADVPPDSMVGRVLRSGRPILLHTIEEWPISRIVKVGGRETQDSQAAIFVPITFADKAVGVISVQSLTPNAYDEQDVHMLETCAVYLGARIYDEVRGEAQREGAQLATRASFDELFSHRWLECGRSAKPLCVLLVDVDLFAAFNDTYGYVTGDACLRQIAGVLTSHAKHPGDVTARYSAEQFAVLLPSCDDTDATSIAEQIRDGVRGLSIAHQGSSLGYMTVSIGFATRVPDLQDDPQTLMSLASRQLARSKVDGRNRASGEGYQSKAQIARRRAAVRHNLPTSRTAFYGRANDVANVKALLEEHALVTLTGIAGSGKTRVALEVAHRSLDRYPDGIWYVDVTTVATEGVLAQAIAAAAFPGLEVDADRTRLTELLRNRQTLLVLDNCTRLAGGCGILAKELTGAAPGVRILATSRKPLRVDLESVYELGSLDVNDSVALFMDRTNVSPERAREVAERLGGIPLAIELVAAQASAFTSDTLGESLTKPHMLHALLDWSYALLAPQEQSVFRRLAAFSDGWTVPAASAVCGNGEVKGGVSTVLDSLAAKSLVVRDGDETERRFRFAEGVHEYAAATLLRSDEADVTAFAHVRYFASYARDLLERKGQMPFEKWSKLQVAEFDNYRVALRRALGELEDSEAAAEILKSLSGMLLDFGTRFDFSAELRTTVLKGNVSQSAQATFWMAISELRRLKAAPDSLHAARRALDLYRSSGDDIGTAYAAWLLAGSQLRSHGKIETSLEPILEKSLTTAQATNDRHLTVGLLRNLAYLRSEDARHDEARGALRQAADLADGTDIGLLAALLGSTALEEFRNGNVEAAIGMWRQAASLVEEMRPAYAALCFVYLGLGEITRGDLVAGRVALRKGLQTLKIAGHPFGVALSFDGFAHLAKRAGDSERATRLAGYSQASFERGPSRASTEQRLFYELTEALRRTLGNVAYEREWNRGQWMSLDEASAEADGA
ncbi:MAG TPA: diguanylate cyclase [Candidatus Cybelea sp.]|nr:diguanylate cyclase [Candidatus Cybelea sp.]